MLDFAKVYMDYILFCTLSFVVKILLKCVPQMEQQPP